MTNETRASALVLEPVIELLASELDPAAVLPDFPASRAALDACLRGALESIGLEQLPTRGASATIRDVLAIPGGSERMVAALLSSRSPAKPPVRATDADDDDDELETWIDYALPCGIAIRIDGVERASPGCCSDWGTLADLLRAVDAQDDGPFEVWMGHDCSRVTIAARDSDTVVLETTSRVGTSERLVVGRALIREAVEDAWAIIDRFESLVRPVIDARMGQRTARSRDRFTG